MSSRSNDQGRAFEYACIIELKDRIEDYRPVIIDEYTVSAAKRAWMLCLMLSHFCLSATEKMMLSFCLSIRIQTPRVEMFVILLLPEILSVGILVYR